MTEDIGATSLTDRIAEFTTAMAKNAPPEVVTALDAELRKLAESGIAKGALRVGEKVPDFSLPDPRGVAVTLSVLLRKGPVVSRSGLVRLAHVDPDYTRRLEPAAILEALRGTRS
jgi:hypothetical protein